MKQQAQTQGGYFHSLYFYLCGTERQLKACASYARTLTLSCSYRGFDVVFTVDLEAEAY